MIQTLIGKKIDQTQKFLENGKRVPVTLIHITDNAVLQVKTVEKDQYAAVQLGFGTKKKNVTKSQLGHAKKAGLDQAATYIREVRLVDEAPAAGEFIAVDAVFKAGDIVSVSGVSKGKGFAGVVKRHGFGGGPKTHGQSDRERAPGSIGQTTTPGRVYKGKRMAGRMGSDNVTIENLIVVGIDPETKMLMVLGLIPGHRNGIVIVTKTGEKKNVVELLEIKTKREAKEAEEAAKAAKIAEEEAAKAPKVEETEEPKVDASTSSAQEEVTVETAPEVVADATETVVVAKDSVGESVEEVKVEATVTEPEVITKEEVKEEEAK